MTARAAGGSVEVTITVTGVNDDPVFREAMPARSVSESAEAGDLVGAAVTATDVDGDTLSYRLSGSPDFDIDPGSGQITVADGTTLSAAVQSTYQLTVTANDGAGGSASIDVTITVTAGPVTPPIVLPPIGVGYAAPSGPTGSAEDFAWTVDRDIEALDEGNAAPTGIWGDGATLWVLQNGEGADDAVYAYDLATGERVEEREFELHETNRAPRGIWSDGETAWVSDSGRDRLFAYGLEDGARAEDLEFELAGRNRDARGIWSGDATLWVLDGSENALFAYNLASGALLGEYELAPANGDPRGIWSDGVSVWVSDHAAKRLFAYRLPAAPDEPAAAAADAVALTRVQSEEFTELTAAGNNSPRGLWSDGAVMYVADASDDKVYS